MNTMWGLVKFFDFYNIENWGKKFLVFNFSEIPNPKSLTKYCWEVQAISQNLILWTYYLMQQKIMTGHWERMQWTLGKMDVEQLISLFGE